MFDNPDKATATTVRSIWFGFLAAPVAYALVGWFVLRESAAGTYPSPLTGALILAAAAAVGLGIALPTRLAAGQAPPAGQAERLGRYQTLMIVRWACFEAPAVIGLALLIISRQVLPGAAGAVISLVLIYASRPDLDRWSGGR